jgi:hypothetical protein
LVSSDRVAIARDGVFASLIESNEGGDGHHQRPPGGATDQPRSAVASQQLAEPLPPRPMFQRCTPCEGAAARTAEPIPRVVWRSAARAIHAAKLQQPSRSRPLD